jgi:polysaccharide export outer membrane protein
MMIRFDMQLSFEKVTAFRRPGYVLSSVRTFLALLVIGAAAACNSLPTSGPSVDEVTAASRPTASGETRFALVEIDANVVVKMEGWAVASLQGTFGQQRPASSQAIGVGDYVQVTIWEIGPGLFSALPTTDRGGAGSRPAATIPEQLVGSDGAITVPFAGRVRVAGRTPQQAEAAIVESLDKRASNPQVLVTVTKNVANTVTVVGEVTGGARVPLTTRGDRILDVVAQAGGTKAPAHETFVTLLRDGRSARLPMQVILTNPAENVYVRAGDVISVSREPQTFTAAGAMGFNSVIPFDAAGITLDQAIARSGGLNDARADPTGIFVIRYEPLADYEQLGLRLPNTGARLQVPVIYRANMRDPNNFFMARRFPVHNKDIIYVSNAPATDVQKVVNVLLPFLGVGATAVAVNASLK